MPFVAAASRHPLATHAVGEVVGQVLERGGGPPDLLLAWVAPPFAGALEDIDAALAATLAPRSRAVLATEVPVGAGLEIDDGSGIVVFAASVGTPAGELRASWAATGEPVDQTARDGVALILADDASTAAERAEELEHRDVAPVLGGNLVRTGGRGMPDAIVDGQAHHGGIVTVVVPAALRPRIRASHGCEPLGDPLVVTAARPGLIEEIAGEPALDRLLRWVAEAPPEDRARLAQHLRLGVALDEHPVERDGEDFEVLRVLGGDRTRRAVAVDGAVEIGQTVQLHAADERAAEHDLRTLIADAQADAVLMLPCATRRRAATTVVDRDVTVVAEQFDGAAVAGSRVRTPFGLHGGRVTSHEGGIALLLLEDPLA